MDKSLETRFQKADSEFYKLGKWRITETEKIIHELKSKGEVFGLDGDIEELNFIRKEYYRRILEIFDKYELPNKPNFDKWLR